MDPQWRARGPRADRRAYNGRYAPARNAGARFPEVELNRYRWIAALAAAFFMSAAAADEDDPAALKADAVSRLARSHDATLSVDIGRVYVKQTALKTARDLLAERGKAAGLGPSWNPGSPEWRAAERVLMQGVDQLIGAKVMNAAWVEQAWAGLASALLNGEEADEIAVHFRTEGGALQRQVIEWFVGELTLQTYTFTDRLKYGVPGSEEEMRQLQIATYERKERFPPIYDLTGYPDAMRFASADPGVKYMKMMVTQGVYAVHQHLEAVAEEARAMIRARAALVDPYIARARGTAASGR